MGRRTNMETSGTAPWGTVNREPGTLSYTTNNLNQYSEISSYSPQPTAYSLSYDLDGNLTQISDGTNGSNYFYDGENRLIRVEPQTIASGTTKVEFAYDYMGRRVEKKVFSYTTGSWLLASDSFFLYDGWNMVSEQITRNSQPVTEKRYVYGLDLSQTFQGAGGIGGLIASVDSNTNKMYYYLYDANGNVGQLLDSVDGSLTAHYEYDPYGNLLTKAGSYADQNPYRFASKYFDQETGFGYWGYRYYSPSLGRWLNRDPLEELGHISLRELPTLTMWIYEQYWGVKFGFPGQYEDVETGLHYNWNRYYDPKSGRYLTPDPVGIEGGINLYAYVKNNPVNLKDVLGLDCDIEFCVLAPAFMPDWWPTMGGPYVHAYLKVGNYGAYGFTRGPGETLGEAKVQPEPRVRDPRAKCFPVKRSKELGCECRSCESVQHCVLGNIEVGALHPYNFLKYNCWDWATQSVEKCCMKVSTPGYMNPAHVRDDFY
jgi:RHS repeat-associated protein